MTRRQVLFHSAQDGRYYMSDEYNGDKVELELVGSADSCDKTWDEMMEDVRASKGLWGYMQLLHKLDGYYHSCLPKALPGVLLRSVMTLEEVECKDETYLIEEADGTVRLVPELSLLAE